MTTIRKDAVKGQFYPSDPKEIIKMFEHYNSILDEHMKDKSLLTLKPRAVVVPHAGYIYSAFTANIAMRLLANSRPRRVVIIGPSHRVYLKGSSVSDYDQFETPLGNVEIDKALVSELKEKFGLTFVPDAHHEHSTEVQVPFIKYYMPEAKVVEIVYGDEDPARLAKVIDYLLDDPETAVVISTDLSHYYDILKAKQLDNYCLRAVKELNSGFLHKECEACGKIGLEAMILTAREKGLKSLLLDYRTSADASKDTSNVVGYMSAAFVE
jgi:AmmeMemoRadiSam system protein B